MEISHPFKSFFQCLVNVTKQHQKDSGYIRRHGWHLTIQCNTFNKYHCYDVHYAYRREINPVWLRLNIPRPFYVENGASILTTEARLMCISLYTLEDDDSNDSFWFYLETKEYGLTRLSFKQFEKSDYVLMSIIPPPYEHIDLPLHFNIKYSFAVDLETYRVISPVNSDITKEVDDEEDLSIGPDTFFKDGNGTTVDWRVNLKYVAPYRIDRTEDFTTYANNKGRLMLAFEEDQVKDLKLDEIDYMIDYLFGTDMSDVFSNFDSEGHKPRTTIAWDSDIEDRLVERGVIPTIIKPRYYDKKTDMNIYNETFPYDDTYTRIVYVEDLIRYDKRLEEHGILLNYMIARITSLPKELKTENMTLNGSTTSIVKQEEKKEIEKIGSSVYSALGRDELEYLIDIRKEELLEIERAYEEATVKASLLLS